MNMYLYELKAYRNTTLIWTGSIAALVLLMMSIYPSFAKDADAFREVIESMPEAVMKAVGIQLDTIASLLGFYSYIFLYVTLCGSIQAMHLGASILSKETREKTADFLLSKPVTRGAVFASKTLAALTLLLLTNAVFFAASSLIASAVKLESFDYGTFALISLSLLLIQLVFLAIGIAAALLLPRMRTVLPVTLGTVFAFFIISFIGATTGDGKLRYLTPFQYYDRAYIMEHSGYEPEFIAASAVIIVACTAFGILRYLKRDVHAV
ncbi:ABC transporter permease subunit [Paenibacillus sp. LHD-117]|uniref:ABC transporter permease subunit n=1 Tax=Paenibacillus sp. LHD-117 TaxID=3071412 RepID=UPI0027DEB2E2|nr:ABC transporter permease subunit [Paenibacillus sp. LHD-117]MDQ6418825.1 ABC transporter permease subunit [Paenibacillus sp. LHD-117]